MSSSDPPSADANQARLSSHYSFVKPNDIRALDLMNAAAQHVIHILPDVVLGYGHSDEYSFVLHKSCTLFERRSAKIASTVVSTFTAAYIHLWSKFFSIQPVPGTFFASKGHTISIENKHDARKEILAEPSSTISTDLLQNTQMDLDLSHLPTFDARCVSYPSNQNLRDYISWRQADCHVNNLYNTTFWALVLKGGMSNTEAEEFLKGTLSSDKNEILWSRFGVNYNNESEIFKKGSVVTREYQLVEPSKVVGSNEDGDEVTEQKDLSKTQMEKMKKARQKARVVVQHVDIIKDEFWLRRPWLLSGRPGIPALGA